MLDVCLLSNLVTRTVPSLASHPPPGLLSAGVACSLSTDDPAMFGTDLSTEYGAAMSLGLDPERLYWAGLGGALCQEPTKIRLARPGPVGGLGRRPPDENRRRPALRRGRLPMSTRRPRRRLSFHRLSADSTTSWTNRETSCRRRPANGNGPAAGSPRQ